MLKCSTDKGCQWIFGPAGSSWYQGAAEALIKGVKICFTLSSGVNRLSPSEFCEVCYEAANTLNGRPLGRIPDEGSEMTIPIPNSLLLGRSTTSILNSSQRDIQSSKSRLGLVNQVNDKFWENWVELFVYIRYHIKLLVNVSDEVFHLYLRRLANQAYKQISQ